MSIKKAINEFVNLPLFEDNFFDTDSKDIYDSEFVNVEEYINQLNDLPDLVINDVNRDLRGYFSEVLASLNSVNYDNERVNKDVAKKIIAYTDNLLTHATDKTVAATFAKEMIIRILSFFKKNSVKYEDWKKTQDLERPEVYSDDYDFYGHKRSDF